MLTIHVTGVNTGQKHQVAMWANKRTKGIIFSKINATTKTRIMTYAG
jgi:hypothetical protein